ncbi:MAG TPA: hypothetical protein VF208_02250 [Candidatus Binatia bacterium]
MTLWRPGESAAILSKSSAARTVSPLASGAPVEPLRAQDATATALPATLANPARILARTNTKGAAESQWRRIWRGDSSLARIFCCYAVFHFVSAAIISNPPWEELAGFGFFFAGAFAALVTLQLGGGLVFLRAVWQATLRYSVAGGLAPWSGLARGAALVTLIAGIHLAILTCMPRLVELTNIAAGVIPTGDYQLRLVRGGTELVVDGAIGIGLSKNVAQALDRNPLVQALQLDSNGGSASESRKLRDLIAARKLSTTTSQGCYGECTLAYMAGAPRRIGEQASLRFYRSAQPGMPTWALWRDYEHDRRDWLARGVPAFFADQALTVRDAAGWQPSVSELITAKIVSPSLATVEPQVGDNGQDTAALLDRELRRAPFFTLLKEQEPEGYRKLVGEIQAGLQSPGNTENIQLRIHPMAKAVSYARLAHAEDTLLLEYAELILEQISLLYSESAQVCNRYFGMDLSGAALDSTKYFSEEMLAKETGLMADMLRSSAARAYRPPARQTIKARWDMILALIGKRYGDKAVLFFETRQASRDPGQTCHVLYEFYKAVSRLPAREAGPLLRYHFAQLQARSLPQTPPAHPAKQVTSHYSRTAHRRSAH